MIAVEIFTFHRYDEFLLESFLVPRERIEDADASIRLVGLMP